MDRNDQLIDRLAADLAPVRPQRASAGWWLLALAVLATTVGVHAAFGLRPQTALQADGRWFLLGELLLATLGLACAIAAIAMLFMTRGPLPHEDTWAAWFEAAANQLPVSMALSLGCEKKVLKSVKEGCLAPADAPVLQRQRLFDVHIHVGLQNEDFTGAALCFLSPSTQQCAAYVLWVHCL